MTMREHVNLAYHLLTDGKDEAARAEIDVMLAPPELKEKYQAKKDRLAHEKLVGQMRASGLMPAPPPRRTS